MFGPRLSGVIQVGDEMLDADGNLVKVVRIVNQDNKMEIHWSDGEVIVSPVRTTQTG